MRNHILMSVLGLAMTTALPMLGGCSVLDGSSADRHDHRDRGSNWRDNDNNRDRYRDTSDYARTAGERNTRIADKVDDGRINDSARTYEERKASRAADEGYPGAARREAELRNDRLDR